MDKFRNGFQSLLREHPGAHLELHDSAYFPEGSTVTGTGQWTMTFPEPDGSKTILEGRYSETMIRRNGKMYLLVDHASIPLPPSEAPPVVRPHAQPHAKAAPAPAKKSTAKKTAVKSKSTKKKK